MCKIDIRIFACSIPSPPTALVIVFQWWCGVAHGCQFGSELDQIDTKNGTNLGFLNLSFKYIFSHRTKMYWKRIFKIPRFVPFSVNLVQFGTKLGTVLWHQSQIINHEIHVEFMRWIAWQRWYSSVYHRIVSLSYSLVCYSLACMRPYIWVSYFWKFGSYF